MENKIIQGRIQKVMKDSLYSNSIYLMLSSAVMAGCGFLSWLIVARLFSVNDVGLATTMISAMGLIASLSVLGFNVGLIRYLPNSKRRNEKINTSFTLVILTTVIISSIFLLGLKWFSPDLLFLQKSLLLSVLFIIFMVVSSSSSIIESIFMAFRETKYILIKNSAFGVLRLGLPFAFFMFGAFGIFSAYVSALFVGVGVVMFFLVKRFHYRPKFEFHDKVIKNMGRYSIGNYVAGFIGGLSLFILPLMITNVINPTTTAYYFMAMQIAALLFVIPTATTNSLFAEGSNDKNSLKKQIRKSVKIISALLVPAIIILGLFGDYILLAFGKEYALEGFNFLRVMLISGVFVAGNKIFEGVAKVNKNITKIGMVNLIGVIVIIGGAALFIQQGLGLMGVGYAYILGQGVMTLVYGVCKMIRKC